MFDLFFAPISGDLGDELWHFNLTTSNRVSFPALIWSISSHGTIARTDLTGRVAVATARVAAFFGHPMRKPMGDGCLALVVNNH